MANTDVIIIKGILMKIGIVTVSDVNIDTGITVRSLAEPKITNPAL